MAELCSYVIEQQIAVVTIDHPPMNALDEATKEAIGRVFDELDQRRDELRAAILRGAGEKAFVAGADINSFLTLTPDAAKRRQKRTHAIVAKIEDFQWPVIAAIDGFCLGGGLELALCCDVRYAEEQSRFGFPEVNLAIFPGNGGTVRSLRHAPLGKVKELIFGGEMISAQEALACGLIEKVVPRGQALEAAMTLARRIAGRGPLGVAAAKKSINRARELSVAMGLESESDLWSGLCATEDQKEGARAFLEKRQPKFLGR